jgi:hypothetical protein
MVGVYKQVSFIYLYHFIIQKLKIILANEIAKFDNINIFFIALL